MPQLDQTIVTPLLAKIADAIARLQTSYMLWQEYTKTTEFSDIVAAGIQHLNSLEQIFDVRVYNKHKPGHFVFDTRENLQKIKSHSPKVFSPLSGELYFAGDINTPTNKFCAYLYGTNFAIKTTKPITEPIVKYLTKNRAAARELFNKAWLLQDLHRVFKHTNNAAPDREIAASFHTNYPLFLQTCALNYYINLMVSTPYVELVETTRKLLFYILTEHHWSDIAATQGQAKNLLQQDKDLIYAYANKYGYANVDYDLTAHNDLRNLFAHPEEHEILLNRINLDIPKIIIAHTEVLCRVLDENFIIGIQKSEDDNFYRIYPEVEKHFSKYGKPNVYVFEAYKMWPDVLSRNINSFNLLKTTDKSSRIIDKQTKHTGAKKTKDKLSHLQNDSTITAAEAQIITDSILTRNKVAHNNDCPNKVQTVADAAKNMKIISEKLTEVLLKNNQQKK